MDRGAWWATVHGVGKSQTRLSGSAHMGMCTHTHTRARARTRTHAYSGGHLDSVCIFRRGFERGEFSIELGQRSTVSKL